MKKRNNLTDVKNETYVIAFAYEEEKLNLLEKHQKRLEIIKEEISSLENQVSELNLLWEKEKNSGILSLLDEIYKDAGKEMLRKELIIQNKISRYGMNCLKKFRILYRESPGIRISFYSRGSER